MKETTFILTECFTGPEGTPDIRALKELLTLWLTQAARE